jgi:hypothetical protein
MSKARPRCPKCLGFLMPDSAVALRCWNCGHLIERDVVVMVKPKKLTEPVVMVKDEYAVLCDKYLPSIIKERKQNTSWSTIARLISISEGRKLNEKTIYNHCRKAGVI